MAESNPLYEVIWQVRRLFQVLATQGNALHEASGLTTAQRAVLEFLDQDEPQTVPRIAKSKSVTRQHIQVIVNELLEKRLVEAVENPAHQRSPLIRRTARGRKLYSEARTREARALAGIARRIPEKDLATTLATLRLIEARARELS
jgi:DNA-binding MarR family transcriptional regulator